MAGRTVLIIHPGTLGDVLLARPAMRAVTQAYPRHRLGLLAGGEVARLLRSSAEAQQVFSLESDGLTGLLSGPESVKEPLRQWVSRCDLAVGWMADTEGRVSATLRESGVRTVIVRSPNSAASRVTHQSDRFLETIQDAVGIGGVRSRAGLNLPGEVRQAGEERLASLGSGRQPVVMVHPGSGSPHKCSEPALLADVIDRLHAGGFFPLLIGGPADDDHVGLTAAACSRPPLILQRLDLLSVAGVMAHVSLFVGHDSGLTHLAAALGRPTVALFGPTDAERWSPAGSHVTVLRGHPCECHGGGEVAACRDRPCLRIAIDDLLRTCHLMLGLEQDSVA